MTFINDKAMITAKNEIPFIKKQKASPYSAIKNPPNVGPMNLAVFTSVELSATALGSNDLSPTISNKNACRNGVSKASAKPLIRTITSTNATLI